jgi:hypothetical protein
MAPDFNYKKKVLYPDIHFILPGEKMERIVEGKEFVASNLKGIR